MTGTTLQSSPITLVIIEDQKLARIGITTVFGEHNGVRVIGEAETGGEGLKLVEAESPDVVIVDLGLPDMEGVELIRQLKVIHPDGKIVVLTVHDVDNLILEALMAGASAYCLKEKISERLVETVKTVHEGEYWLDPKAARKVVQALSSRRQLWTGNTDANSGNRGAADLTEREHKILSMIVQGMNNTEIAEALHVSYHTVKSDVTQILMKLEVNDRTQAAVKALRDNLV